MLIRIGAASLLALSLYAGGALAQDAEPAPGEQPAEQAAPADQPAAEQAAPADQGQEQTQDQAIVIPPEVQALLDDTRAVSEMDVNELRARARAARNFAKQQGLPDDVRARLQQIAQEARAELDNRANQPPAAAEQPAEQPPAEAEQPAEPPPAASDQQQTDQAAPADEQQPVQKKKRKKTQDQMQTQEQTAPAEQPAEQPAQQPAEQAAPAEQAPIVNEPPVEQAAPAEQPPPPPVVDKKEVQELDANPGNPEAEQKARAYLDDQTPAENLSDEDLKTRLDGMRDLMADNELSNKTERALRKKLQAEREILRARIAAKEEQAQQEKLKQEAAKAAQDEQQAGGQGTGKADKGGKRPRIIINPQITINTPVQEVLRDRRRSEDLSDSELRRRVQVYRDAQGRDDWQDFDEQDREYWRESMQRDREQLRRRMAEERRAREEEMAMNNYDDEELDIEDSYVPGRRVPRSVFEAEADDSELEDVLISPPRKKVRERYTVDEIASNRELRDSMPRIDIDTIRFGFNEAFVREEEVGNLDRIAGIIEKVLRKRPREVFLIEGHTDAVGSDAYNLKLSRARAEAVKKALTTYYVISPRNLQTVGLGERYLKIPTAEPEQENRRVSISRATPLVGQLEE